MRRNRLVSGTAYALVVTVSVVLIAFGIVEQFHTHAPWGPPSENRTLTGVDRTDAGPGDCLACRAASERGAGVPPQIAAAASPDGDALDPSQDRATPTMSIDRAVPPRGPPLAPPRRS